MRSENYAESHAPLGFAQRRLGGHPESLLTSMCWALHLLVVAPTEDGQRFLELPKTVETGPVCFVAL